jgi:hypothetical protein
MRLTVLPVLLLLAVPPAACETHFTGDPHYPGGPTGCRDSCARQGMEMSSFIYSGEFATSCVCRPLAEPPVATPPAPAAAPGALPAPAPSARRDDGDVEDAAAVGVVLQQRRNEEQSGAAAGSAR